MTHYRKGDRLPGAAGTIQTLSLDGLEIATAPDKPLTHIGVGQNLAGVVSVRTVETAPTTSTTTADSTGSATTAPAGGGPEDMIERLKRLRLQSLNK